jgi:hypothetical protein
MMEQLENHEQHCAAILSDWRDLEIALESAKILGRHCFFLNKKGKLLNVRKKLIELTLAPYLPLPANFYRKFMRTNLAERQCSTEIIDTWMGHWDMGQEPWGNYSSFSGKEYILQLKKYLLPLLDEIDWKPIKSVFIDNV